MGKIDTPDGPLHSTVVDGCVVHGSAPLSEAGREAVGAVIRAARLQLPPLKPDQIEYLDRIRAAGEDFDGSYVVGGPKKKPTR